MRSAKYLSNIKHRIYSDYFLPNRLSEYAKLLDIGIHYGYKIVSLIDYYDLQSEDNNGEHKFIVCRHDIDTSPETAKAFFEIEKQRHVKSSFYFRLCTLSEELMYEIDKYGSEASYHFEEIASYCKRNKIKNQEEVRKKMPEIQTEFIDNFLSIKEKVKTLKMRSVASHGDFMNRYIKIINHELLTPRVRKRCGIEVEAYDSIIRKNSFSISDAGSPQFWKPEPIVCAIKRKEPVIHFLTHPRHWIADPWNNTKDNIVRVLEELKYRF